jgi:hypothetical protein
LIHRGKTATKPEFSNEKSMLGCFNDRHINLKKLAKNVVLRLNNP